MATPARKLCPRCGASVPLEAPACLRAGCGHQFRTAFTQRMPEAPAASHLDTCALLSTVFGGVAIAFWCFFGWLFGIAAVALGIVSIFRQRADSRLTGMPLAIIGIALGAVPLLFFAALAALTVIGALSRPATQ